MDGAPPAAQDREAAHAGTPLLEARNLVKEYTREGAAVRVVDGVSLAIHPGETLGLVGESGCGKSTVARMLLRLIEPTSGEIAFAGESILAAGPRRMKALRRRMQVVFQDPYAALNPRMRVRDLLAEPFAIHRESPPEGIETRLARLLESVGLDRSALPRYPHEFSGGQRQRINIARALVLGPELLVLDEPVSALDVSVGAQVINLLRELQSSLKLACLFISHSMPLVRYVCDRIAVMQAGRIVETGPTLQLCDAPHHAYTRQLIAATPKLPDAAQLAALARGESARVATID
ncbi:MAG: ATP-binding cassette domain-containing protein [Acidobacteriota bacterium]|nr:ATP-binding cassette domain-containing protein [Acidobacteriota bacterium]